MRTGQPSTYLLPFMEVSIHQNCNFKIVHCCKIHTYSVANVFLCLSCIMLSTIMLAGAHGATSGGSARTVVVRGGGSCPHHVKVSNG